MIFFFFYCFTSNTFIWKLYRMDGSAFRAAANLSKKLSFLGAGDMDRRAGDMDRTGDNRRWTRSTAPETGPVSSFTCTKERVFEMCSQFCYPTMVLLPMILALVLVFCIPCTIMYKFMMIVLLLFSIFIYYTQNIKTKLDNNQTSSNSDTSQSQRNPIPGSSGVNRGSNINTDTPAAAR